MSQSQCLRTIHKLLCNIKTSWYPEKKNMWVHILLTWRWNLFLKFILQVIPVPDSCLGFIYILTRTYWTGQKPKQFKLTVLPKIFTLLKNQNIERTALAQKKCKKIYLYTSCHHKNVLKEWNLTWESEGHAYFPDFISKLK